MDFFSKYITDDLWCFKEHSFTSSLQNIRESQLSLGNGFIGTRGILEEIPKDAIPGTYLAGVFDSYTSQVSELINFPNPINLKFIVNGEKVGVVEMDVESYQRSLNMREGILLRKTTYLDSKKHRYDYGSARFVSMYDKNLIMTRSVFVPRDQDVTLEAQTGIDMNIFNSGTVAEGKKKHFALKDLTREEGHVSYRVLETLEKKKSIIYWNASYYSVGSKKVGCTDGYIKIRLKKNKPIVLTTICRITPFDSDMSLKKQRTLAKKLFYKAYRQSFDVHFRNHARLWHQLWDIADIEVEGTADLQRNIRFNIYHMLICAREDNGESSIGARTLSGEGYHGHVFWDAEIFMLPFYAHVLPSVARNMLVYRYRRIPQARDIANRRGYKGVMFPWESADSGYDETPSWAKDLNGKIIPIKTNELEHHITADIAYAIVNYYEVTGDELFMRDYGYQMIFEIARFWASRVKRNKTGRYEIRDVIGPDEFHEHVNNNAYTNMMAKWCLLVGRRYFVELKSSKKKLLKRIAGSISLSSKEVGQWQVIAPRIHMKMRRDRVIEEFDGYFRKNMVDLVEFDENHIPALPEGISVQDYNKTQLVKQADVLMLLYLLSEVYTKRIKENNYRYYYNRTLHKSSLSVSIHSLMALESGEFSQAYQFFNVALRADVSNLHGNTSEGIHAASLGGVWQNVIHGFAGARTQRGVLHIDPVIPRTWRKIRFSLIWKGSTLRVETSENEVSVHMDKGTVGKLKVAVFGKIRLLNAGKRHMFKRAKQHLSEGYY